MAANRNKKNKEQMLPHFGPDATMQTPTLEHQPGDSSEQECFLNQPDDQSDPASDVKRSCLQEPMEHEKNAEKVFVSADDSHKEPTKPVAGTKVTQRQKRRCWKNLLVLGAAFFFGEMGFISLRDLQSSINHKNNLGVLTLAFIFSFFIFSTFLVTPLLRNVGTRKSLWLGMLTHTIYAAANIYPRMYTLLPTAALAGLGRAAIWSSQAVHLTSLGLDYADLTGQPAAHVISRFTGLVLVCQRSAAFIGGTISSTVLQRDNKIQSPDVFQDLQNTSSVENSGHLHELHAGKNSLGFYTHLSNETVKCGAHYCHSYGLTKANSGITELTFYILMGTYFCSGLISLMLIKFLLDEQRPRSASSSSSLKDKFLAMFRALRDVKLMLLLPFNLYYGLQLSFYYSDVLKAFVTCPVGISKVGYVITCSAFFSATGVFGGGFLQKYLGRKILIATVFLIQSSFLLWMLLWKPDVYKLPLLFLLAGGWGLSDGLFLGQQQSLLGDVFRDKQEPVFASLYLFHSLGQVSTFVSAPFLCINVKAILTLTVLILAVTGYIVVEIIFWKLNRNNVSKDVVSCKVIKKGNGLL